MVVHPPSPRSVHAKLKSVSLSPPRALRRLSQPLLQSAITNFILTPHSQPHVPEPTQAVSIFTRLMAVIKNHAPSHSYSFTLSPVPGALTPAKGFVPIAPAPAGQEGTDPLTPMPLLTFHDRTPVFTAYRRSGLLEMDEQQCRNLGVEPSFYIAAALTYLEFLEDREVSSFVHLLACCFDQRTLLSASEHPCAELPGGSLRLMPARGSPRAGRGLRLRAPGIRPCYVFNLFYVSDPEGIVPYRIASMIFPLSQIARAYALSALLSPLVRWHGEDLPHRKVFATSMAGGSCSACRLYRCIATIQASDFRGTRTTFVGEYLLLYEATLRARGRSF